ncbi:transporter [Roseateles chitinivorans]|uniref:transporter n=1 Tax=Roseateles chitinivorans TaxID=2917965 RepID=UPI003D677E31
MTIPRTLAMGATLCSLCFSASAAEYFQLRYNIAGGLGGEVFSPIPESGWIFSGAATRFAIDKITGPDGGKLQIPVTGGVFPLPAPAPPALYPSYSANISNIDAGGSLSIVNLTFGKIWRLASKDTSIALLATVPFGRKVQIVSASATTPQLSWPSPVAPPTAAKTLTSEAFDKVYQAGIRGAIDPQNGTVSGIGDAEIQVGVLHEFGSLRTITGAALVMPTGKYDSQPAPDIGGGNFYTIRPSFQVTYQALARFAVAGKFSLGINSKNKDTHVRSGTWGGAEFALAYLTDFGVLGLHSVYIKQLQDDAGNPLGASRFESRNVGVFFTTKLPGEKNSITLQAMRPTSTRNAKTGDIFQVRTTMFF